MKIFTNTNFVESSPILNSERNKFLGEINIVEQSNNFTLAVKKNSELAFLDVLIRNTGEASEIHN